MAEVVPCLADELQVQAMQLEAATASEFDDDVFNGLDIGPQGYAHSSRDHSLLEISDFMGPDSEVFGSYEFPPLDGLNAGSWCLGNPSNGLSSGASCDLSNEIDAANLGLSLSSGKRSSASSGQMDSYSEETWDAAGNPASGDLIKVAGLHHVNSAWQSRGMLEPVSASFPMPVPKAKGTSHKSNFVPGQGHSQPEWMAPSFRRTDSSGWKSGNGLNSKTNVMGPLGHQLCLSPLSGVSTDMSLDLGASIEDDLLGHDGGEDGSEARLYTDRQWLMTSERTKKQQASREDLSFSPKASGVKRQASTTVARKLMTHPEGNSCQQCGAKSTPVWRAGPAGPKTLCNACGVRYSKIARKK